MEMNCGPTHSNEKDGEKERCAIILKINNYRMANIVLRGSTVMTGKHCSGSTLRPKIFEKTKYILIDKAVLNKQKGLFHNFGETLSYSWL